MASGNVDSNGDSTLPEGNRTHFQSLAAAGVGAISLAQVATPFELRDGENRSRGEVRSSGVYLRENGSAGTIQQIDLSI